jgi:hypothetical protein
MAGDELNEKRRLILVFISFIHRGSAARPAAKYLFDASTAAVVEL